MNNQKMQMLVRILVGQKENEQDNFGIDFKILEQANSKGYVVSKLKIFKSKNHEDVKIVIFEADTKEDARFPGCFRVHRDSKNDVYYTLNALIKMLPSPVSPEEKEKFFENNKNKLLTMFNGNVVEYELEAVYGRIGDKVLK